MKKIYLNVSFLLSAIIVLTSLYGLFYPGAYTKETANWTAQVIAQDWVNLIVGVPVLLISALLAYKKSLKSYFVWLGNLIFIVYSFAIYAFDIHYNHMFFPYVAILGLSFYLLVFSFVGLDFDQIKKSFDPKWAGTALSNLLLVTGCLFYLLWLSSVAGFLKTGKLPSDLESAGLVTNPVHVLDLAIFLPSSIISSLLLKKKIKYGYVFPFIILIAMILLSINIIAINIVVEMRGLGSARILTYIFCIVVLIYFTVLATALKNLRIKRLEQ